MKAKSPTVQNDAHRAKAQLAAQLATPRAAQPDSQPDSQPTHQLTSQSTSRLAHQLTSQLTSQPLSREEEEREIEELESYIVADCMMFTSPEAASGLRKPPSISDQTVAGLINEALLNATNASPAELPQLRATAEQKLRTSIRLQPRKQIVMWKSKTRRKRLR